ncbi:hypothetical protein MYX76_16435, partial [Desulfobacterota bacterium AH_259_B03_O07]|nr:hypothetical protein [Desulfobacterota bacterium AH_259_B03_O07]
LLSFINVSGFGLVDAFAGPTPPPISGETNCTDGIDNDGDTQIDCDDFDCILDPACRPTPTPQPPTPTPTPQPTPQVNCCEFVLPQSCISGPGLTLEICSGLDVGELQVFAPGHFCNTEEFCQESPPPGLPCSGDSCEPGDANADGFVNLADLGPIINEFRGTQTAPGNGDCNMDGFTNLADLGCDITLFRGPPGPTPTPTPTPQSTPTPQVNCCEFIDPQVLLFFNCISGPDITLETCSELEEGVFFPGFICDPTQKACKRTPLQVNCCEFLSPQDEFSCKSGPDLTLEICSEQEGFTDFVPGVECGEEGLCELCI